MVNPPPRHYVDQLNTRYPAQPAAHITTEKRGSIDPLALMHSQETSRINGKVTLHASLRHFMAQWIWGAETRQKTSIKLPAAIDQ